MYCRTIRLLTYAMVSILSLAQFAHADEAPIKIAMLIPGEIDDGGFMEAGYRGLMDVQNELGFDTVFSMNIGPKREELKAALKQLVSTDPDLIITHGGQTSEVVKLMAGSYPEIQFVVIQGNVTGENLSSYEVLQEESAWLAGAAAGMLTESGTVGHISGLRMAPGLKGRGAFYNGLMATNPEAEYLTTFAGDQDDSTLAYRVATAEIAAGADVIFTMLNAGRQGAIDAAKEKGVWQIGNVNDWVSVDPSVFIGSAIADVSQAVFQAASDFSNHAWESDRIVQIGLDNSNAVRLSLSESVSEEVRDQIDAMSKAIVAGEIDVSIAYSGDEFTAL